MSGWWSRKLEQRRNRGFLNAAMAAAALVSTADDDVRLSEQLALDTLLEQLEKLRVYDPRQGVELHRRYAEGIGSDAQQGRASALEAIAPLKDDRDQAELVLYVASMIARADRELSESERQELDRICQALGLPPEAALQHLSGRAEA